MKNRYLTRTSVSAAVLMGAIGLAGPAFAYSEAPDLAKQVQNGTLPSVDKRLPETPEVITPLESVGTYGGVLRGALRGNGDTNAIVRVGGPNGLTRYSMDYTRVVPHLAERYTVSPNAQEFTFYLRKGTKWSDGSPFTADDMLFAWNDLLSNKEFYVTPLSQYTAGGTPGRIEKIDDFTVKISFSAPNLMFTESLAGTIGQFPVMYQKKYCSQFHPKYNPKIDEAIQAARAQNWAALMRTKCGDISVATRWSNPDKPTLDPWVITEPYTGGATKAALKRNPYFWQVDTAGNQLPYLDEIRFTVISDAESIVLTAINGQLDFQVRHIAAIQNLPVLADNVDKGGYNLLRLPDVNATSVALYLNQLTKSDKLRALLRQKDFRVALSLGMDRSEINDIVFLGQGQPWQVGPRPENKYYNERLGKQYTELDLTQANALLDKLGLTKRDAAGRRLYPDGSGSVALNAIVGIQNPFMVETLEIIRKQWAKIGIELVIQSSERSLYFDRGNNNDYDISIEIAPGGLDPTQDLRAFMASEPQESRQGLGWVKWRDTRGQAGDEPPESMKKRFALYDQWKAATSPDEADDLFRQILALAADELEVLGTVSPPPSVAVANKKLRNIYKTMPNAATYATPGPALVQEWYYAK